MRLRRQNRIVFTCGTQNIATGYICDNSVFEQCISLWIGSERYKHSDNIMNGVITLPYGFRVGVAGTLLINNGSADEIYEISYLNLRFPRLFKGIAYPLYEYLSTIGYQKHSTLLVAPPCSGKTTVLRDIARILSTPPVSERVCVVDTKKEIFPPLDEPCVHMDVFSGYPTSVGIDIATKYFNPRYIICDEIGCENELAAIRSAAHSGVPLIASAHSPSLSDAIRKPLLNTLIVEKIFFNIVELSLFNGTPNFIFHSQREVEQILCTQEHLLL